MLQIAFDSHKRYTVACVQDGGRIIQEGRIEHERGAIDDYLEQWPKGTPVALETLGNWYCLGWKGTVWGLEI